MFREVLTLTSSLVIGQLINLFVLLGVARLVTVDVYGAYAVSITLVGYVSVLAGAKYHHVIFAGSNNDAKLMTDGSYVFTGLLSVFCFLGFLISKIGFGKPTGLSYLDIGLISIAGACSASSLFYYYYCLRAGLTKLIFYSRLIPPLVGGGGMLVCAYVVGSPTGLLFFYCVSNILVLVLLCRGLQSNLDFQKFVGLLRKYKRYPLYLLPAGALEVFNSGFLLLACAELYGANIAAAFGLYYRLIGSPQGLLVSSIGDSLRRRIVETEAALVPKMLFKVGCSVLIVAILGAGFVYLFAKYGLTFLLGEKWSYAGEYFVWMLPIFVCSFVVPPVSITMYIFNGQKYDLLVNAFTAVMYLLIYHFFRHSFHLFIISFVTVNCLKYLLELLMSIKCLKERDETTQAAVLNRAQGNSVL